MRATELARYCATLCAPRYKMATMRHAVVIVVAIALTVIVCVYVGWRDTHPESELFRELGAEQTLGDVSFSRLARVGVDAPTDARTSTRQKHAPPLQHVFTMQPNNRSRSIATVDARSAKCRAKRYENSVAVVSIILEFSDYRFHDLKATVDSLLLNTDDALIGEIIIVDDGSIVEHIIRESRVYVDGIKKAILVRKAGVEGAVRARQSGVAVARGSVFVFVDTSVVCARGWLAPLLAAVALRPTLIAVPHYDFLYDPVSYEYRITSPGLVATFSWSLQVRMSVGHVTRLAGDAPRDSPALRGDVFAVSRAFFTRLGGYDVGFEDAGGAHLELALRAWMCGGAVRVLPCARVAVFGLDVPVRVGSAANAWRITELWLGPMRSLVYGEPPPAAAAHWSAAVASRRHAIATLNCATFESYRASAGSGVYTPGANTTHFGLLRALNGFCAAAAAAGARRVELGDCSLHFAAEAASGKVFELRTGGELVVGRRCLTGTPDAYVEARPCVAGNMRQRWRYSGGRLLNTWSTLCMMHVTDPVGQRQVVMIQNCRKDQTTDGLFIRWEFVRL